MSIIDQTITYKGVEAKLAATTNPRHRKILEQLLQHSRGEVEEDLDAVLGTLCKDPFYRSSVDTPEMNPQGMDGVIRFYKEQIFGKGRHCLEYHHERILVSDDAVVTDGVVRSVHWGQDLVETGVAVDDPDGYYLMTYPMLIVWPVDAAGDFLGEESYARRGGSDYLRKIGEDDLPESFVRYVTRRKAERAAA
jgi:hypothetical protein